MNILHLTSSARQAAANSPLFSQKVIQRLLARHPGAAVQHRDLVADPHPAVDAETLAALFAPAEKRSLAQAQRVAQDDALIAQLMNSDVIVIAAPMYNFAIPVQLKTWIDAVCRVGVTFTYDENGATGLVRNKKLYLVLSRGGHYLDTPADNQLPYLKHVLGFLGMSDIELVLVEGTDMGPDALANGLAQANARIDALFA